ncbi:MAG: response regulator [Pseudomonadota bacterium]
MSKAKVLIVDDEKIVLKAYSLELEEAGFEVFRAASGAEAIAMTKKEMPEIVFTDLVMPGMNGVEICKKIKEIKPDAQVVLISGHPEEVVKYAVAFVDAGGKEEWLRKPLAKDELIETAEKLVKEIKG